MREMHDSMVELLYKSLVEPCSSTMVIIYIAVIANLLFERLPKIALIV